MISHSGSDAAVPQTPPTNANGPLTVHESNEERHSRYGTDPNRTDTMYIRGLTKP
ncbi:hypothetical protein ACFQL7_01295 [Halocatena marina]|uniref:Uncharacterized protein n=1 Tax=Halocatena marina TaxID=2934937 RepID=A0ABD5YLV8_9EURY